MKLFCSVVFFCAFLLTFTVTRAQYLEFTENKGQWDSRVTYGSDMGTMAFFLEKQGYKVLVNNADELAAMEDYYGGHGLYKKGGGDPYHAGQINGSKGSGIRSALPEGLHSHAYEVIFPGSSPNPVIIPEKIIETYNNYFLGNDPSKWASHCRLFQAVTYKNIYPNIDVRYYTNNGQLKYDIIINPGGDISKVALRFDGADGLSIKNGNLLVKTSVGNITELAPIAYQPAKAGKTNIDVKFVIAGNTVYFQTGNFSRSAPLVIDPTLIFSSLSRSIADNWGYTATYDYDGNFYAGGIAFGNGFPTANGPSYQPNFSGGATNNNHINGHDVAIIKLAPKGNAKIFATYLGGTGNEQPHSMVVDKNGDLIVAGRTLSPDFPTNQPAFGPGGSWDIFLTRFNADGSNIIASRKIGGKGDDGVNVSPKETSQGATGIRRNYGDDARSEVITDDAGNIYLAACTQSSDNSPNATLAFGNPFQPNYGGGTQDGMLIKTDPGLNIIFSSYLGGDGQDAAFVLALNPLNNDIYVAGATTSTNLNKADVNNAGILHSTYQGGESDGFVTIISNDGTTQRRTAYVGNKGNDMVYGVQFDRFGYPYVTGTTSQAFPITGNVGFSQQSKGLQFITKLGQGLSDVQYSTNFGKPTGVGKPDISPVAFLVDRCENVYVSGWGGGIDMVEGYDNAGTTGLSVYAKNPNDIIQKITDGQDFYFFVLEKNARSQLYGSFFGELPRQGQATLGDHVDGGTSRFDRNGVIYQAMCANCGKSPESAPGTGFPTSGGNTWGQKNISTQQSYCNEAAVKIAFELAGVGADLRASINGVARDTSGCIPLTVDFTDTIHIAKQYIWDFGDGSPAVATTSNSQSHTYTLIGNYTVRLIAIDSSSCNIADTVYTHIRARSDYADLKIRAKKLLPCTSLRYMFINESVPPAGKPFSSQSLQWVFGDGATLTSNADTVYHDYAAPGTYDASLQLNDTNYCNSPDSVPLRLRIATNIKAQFNIPTGCAPYNAIVQNTSLGGQQFTWDFGDGTPVSTQSDPTHLFQDVGTYTVKMVAVDSSTCNIIDSTTRSVIVGVTPVAAFTFTPSPPKEDEPTTFFNNSINGDRYVWDFGDADTLATRQRDTSVVHQYVASDTYNACLYTYTNLGCIDTACNAVQALVRPLVDVPNAFTPNGDNINDQIHVKGYGIVSMNWKIFNRWGQLVFTSNSQKIGWNGYYKGVLQPQEVYTYVLDVVFFDKTKYQKKGDITLLR